MTPKKRSTPRPAATPIKPQSKPAPAVRPNPKPQPKPEEPTPTRRRHTWYVALLVAGLLLLGSSAALAMTSKLVGFEQRAFIDINHMHAPAWLATQVAKPLSNAVWGMVGLVAVLLAVPKLRFRAWQYAVAGGAAFTLGFLVEKIVGRARPAGLAGFQAILHAGQSGLGFPSTHTAIITALGLTIWPYVGWLWRVLIGVLILAVAWSRIFLGVHAPLDVVGGMGIAMIAVSTIHLLPVKIRKPFWLDA